MGQIFISAAHGGIEKGGIDPGAIVGGTTETKEMIRLRTQIVSELQNRNVEVLSVPDALSLSSTIQWINARGRRGDVALEIRLNAHSNPALQGAAVFYIANNTERKKHADLLLQPLLQRVPKLSSRGTNPDTAIGVGRLPFCRDVVLPSLVMEVGFLTNPVDRSLLQNQRGDFAKGIADGLENWSDAVSGREPSRNYPAIAIKVNNQTQQQKGILVNGNTYVPNDLVTQLGLELIQAPQLRRLQYQGVVYVKAIDLQEYGISVRWDNPNRTLILLQPNPIVRIKLNNQTQQQKGILVDGKAYIPNDLTAQLGLDLIQAPQIRRIQYQGVVYVRTIDLEKYGIAVSWDNANRTVILFQFNQLLGKGLTSEVQLREFLKATNPEAANQFDDLPKLYIDEASIEGINHDIAFCQMCLETNFLRFGGGINRNDNNFGGVGTIAGEPSVFPSAKLGVRAHIQQLKAYAAGREKLAQEPVTDLVKRVPSGGIAPSVELMSKRWSVDPEYGNEILQLVRRLYQSANLL